MNPLSLVALTGYAPHRLKGKCMNMSMTGNETMLSEAKMWKQMKWILDNENDGQRTIRTRIRREIVIIMITTTMNNTSDPTLYTFLVTSTQQHQRQAKHTPR